MCELSAKLIAWLDCELESGEMAEVELHIGECAECQRRLDAYGQMSKTFDAYCSAVVAAKVHRRVPRWVPVVSTAGIAAVVAALFLFLPQRRLETVVLPPAEATAPTAIVQETAPAPSKLVHRRHPRQRVETQNASWAPGERAIRIAIPAESISPPGAFPEGVTFTADLSIGTDGSAEQIRLHPRLIGFERRTTQP
jgi:hypothetical protein